jgi:hypothetical protein
MPVSDRRLFGAHFYSTARIKVSTPKQEYPNPERSLSTQKRFLQARNFGR